MNKFQAAFLIVWLAGIATAQAQLTVGGVNLNNEDIQYIELIGYNRSSTEAVVWIDFGENYTSNKSGEFLKPVPNRESVRFTSVVEALNYCYKNGWELVTTYLPTTMSFHHYVLQRRSQSVKRAN